MVMMTSVIEKYDDPILSNTLDITACCTAAGTTNAAILTASL